MHNAASLPRAAPLDARLVILAGFAFGLLAWRAGPVGLLAYSLGLAWAWVRLARATGLGRAALRGYAFFVGFWMLLKFGLDVFFPAAPQIAPAVAAQETLLLGWRLILVIGIGLALARAASARELGLALCWALRPLVGPERAWRAALALALMIHFLPLAMDTVARVQGAIALRAPRLSFGRRLVLVPAAVFRLISQKTWTQTVAVAARGLDRAEAWQPRFAPQPAAWLCGLAAVAAGWLLAYM